MKNDFFQIAETFYSIQGEGATMGIPSYFIRLAGCNLTCGMKPTKFIELKKKGSEQSVFNSNKAKNASWVCDSMSVWMKGKKVSFEEMLHLLGGSQFYHNIMNGSHIIFTGGEPLLHHKKINNFISFLSQLIPELKFSNNIEIETNGTIIPEGEWLSGESRWQSSFIQINVSPKLSNSGIPKNVRFNKLALEHIQYRYVNSIFKFVVDNYKDVIEIEKDFSFLNPNRIWLMPAASSRSELIEKSDEVAHLALERGWRFSSRLQLVNWDKGTGV